MAKYRFKRRKSRVIPFRAYRRSKHNPSVKVIQPDAMIYGAVRSKVSNMLSPIVSPVLGPLGAYADEAAMALLNYVVAKNTSGLVKDIAIKGLVIENAAVGAAVGNTIPIGNTTTTNTYLYG